MWELLAGSWHYITGAVGIIAFLDGAILLGVIPWILAIKKEPNSAIAWCLLVLLIPFFGAFFFVMFGYQSVHRPLQKKQKHRRRYRQQSSARLVEGATQDEKPDPGYENLAMLAHRCNASPAVAGNAVEFYSDGHTAFDAMFAAIEAATHHVHLEFFIFHYDMLGKRFLDLLARKAKAGVKVRLLVDGIGSRKLRWWHTRAARNAGVRVAYFLPVSLWRRRVQVNLRNHRKVMVIDGRIAFIGGLNVGDEYLGEDPDLGYWRDTHMRIEGPAVESLQRVFVEDWDFSVAEPLRGAGYFLDIPRMGPTTLQVVASGPDQELKSIREVYFAAISKARKRLWIMTPYYVPDPGLRDALCLAGRSGVDVRLLMPKVPDHWMTYFAGRYLLTELLDAGVKVYDYSKGFMHSKVLMVDGQWASVGSANLDNRSLWLNFEANCLIHDPKEVAKLELAFQTDLEDSVRLDAKTFAKRPLIGRLAENLFRLFAPVL